VEGATGRRPRQRQLPPSSSLLPPRRKAAAADTFTYRVWRVLDGGGTGMAGGADVNRRCPDAIGGGAAGTVGRRGAWRAAPASRTARQPHPPSPPPPRSESSGQPVAVPVGFSPLSTPRWRPPTQRSRGGGGGAGGLRAVGWFGCWRWQSTVPPWRLSRPRPRRRRAACAAPQALRQENLDNTATLRFCRGFKHPDPPGLDRRRVIDFAPAILRPSRGGFQSNLFHAGSFWNAHKRPLDHQSSDQ